MPKQPAFPGLGDAIKKKVTLREQFLGEMDQVVPFAGADRAALSEYRAEGRPYPDAAGNDAPGLFSPELVCAE